MHCKDYRKAFDLVDHGSCQNPGFAHSSRNCPLGFRLPHATKLGPWLFILMINDLHPSGSDVWKYVDDTTLAEVVPRGGQSGMQVAVNAVEPSGLQSTSSS